MIQARGYLLDTNVVSEPLRPRPDSGIMEQLREHADRLALAAPVWQELLFGVRRLPPSRRRDSIERYLMDAVRPRVPILSYDASAATWHAGERARLVRLGQTPPFVDGQIAAIAATNDLILVTANASDFATFEGLTIEDWRA